ncbi:hypothetical protein CANCADRAFT_32992 [Tortispora caseinolytica NRRL Y-17796]|uniref:J domain-containing protein n=1 Tax=Tortispora caseinolytica NRRL Y-17796 TaxID=767744 RepID=A0A1E4T9F3_9ASCO|nr:hypothetical protein CANCADRAFT_32992 [Tortispora caseinolytica NRRL Y-17796]
MNPYEVLEVHAKATTAEIKGAYRRKALQHHPDKVPPDQAAEAHAKFQEIALAYAVLSDEQRRKIYDQTGSIEESQAVDDDFDWAELFSSMFSEPITAEMIEQDRDQYRSSGEERRDVIHFYMVSEGDMDFVFENVLHSDILDDYDRFCEMIDGAIAAEEVLAYDLYLNESKKTKKSRKKKAQKEANEAKILAKELGIDKAKTEDNLRSIIMKRQANRFDSLISKLESKYSGVKKRSTKSTKSKQLKKSKSRSKTD